MPVITAHPPGIFCWPELATTDSAAAARFYAALLDWTPIEIRRPDHSYTIFQLDGLDVAAAYAMGRESSEKPHWNSYVSVEDADAAAARAREFGGSVVAEPSAIPDIGRMAVLRDGSGARIGVWEVQAQAGARLLNASGALCWTELVTPEAESAGDFYTRLFGWAARPTRSADYIELFRGEEPIAGILRRGSSGAPSYWLPYFAVDDVDDVIEVARKHGGSVTVSPSDIPMAGRFAVLLDPQGAAFGVYGVNEAA